MCEDDSLCVSRTESSSGTIFILDGLDEIHVEVGRLQAELCACRFANGLVLSALKVSFEKQIEEMQGQHYVNTHSITHGMETGKCSEATSEVCDAASQGTCGRGHCQERRKAVVASESYGSSQDIENWNHSAQGVFQCGSFDGAWELIHRRFATGCHWICDCPKMQKSTSSSRVEDSCWEGACFNELVEQVNSDRSIISFRLIPICVLSRSLLQWNSIQKNWISLLDIMCVNEITHEFGS